MKHLLIHALNHTRLVLVSTWHQFYVSSNTRLLAIALIIGLATGLTNWVFRVAIELTQAFVFEGFAHKYAGYLGGFVVVIGLGGAGIIVGWLTSRFVGTERHRGITGIIESVAVGGGRLPYWRMPAKALASILSLGAGASVGTEDPSVQIGANLGAFIAHKLHTTEEQTRLLIASGAASATAAAFNAPIAGVFFALEVVMQKDFSTSAVSVMVLSSVISAAFSQSLSISEATLQPLDFTLETPVEIIFFIPLALLIPPFAALLIRVLFWQIDFWNRHTAHLPYPLRTGVAGLLVGLVGVFFPQLLGSGQASMNAVLAENMQFALWLLLLLAAGKIFLTGMSISGGFVGGVFTPALFIGTMIGSFYGQIIARFVPIVSDSRVFAVAGMAGMIAGVVRAPITAIMLVFEITNDYQMILPIMLVAIMTMYLTQVVQPEGVYISGLARGGLHLSQGHSVDVMQGIYVHEVMREPCTIPQDTSLTALRDHLHKTKRRSMVIVNHREEVQGIVTLTDLQEAYARPDHGESLCVMDIANRDVATTTPNATLWNAARQMGVRGVGRLPVVEPGTHKLVGVLNRHDLVRAYNAAIADRIREQHYIERIRLQNLTNAHVFELYVRKHAPIANHEIQDIQFPGECTIAAIERDGKLLIPHGDTRLLPGDVITIVAEPEAEDEIARLFRV